MTAKAVSYRICYIFFLLCYIWRASTAVAQPDNPVSWAKPIIGTKGVWLYGRTTPFVTPPFGMTHWTACTRNSRIGKAAYQYYDTKIIGFRASHKPAMWMGDYGYVTLKPAVGQTSLALRDRKWHFSHHHETAKPYYYAVQLYQGRHQITTELTASSRCGILRFLFEGDEPPVVFTEASQQPGFDGWIQIDTAMHEIIGWNSDRQSAHLGPSLPNFKGYFVIQFSEAFTAYGVWNADSLMPGNMQWQSERCGAWVSFAKGTKVVQATTATSFISIEQARENLQREVAGQSLEQVSRTTEDEWNDYLSRIRIDSATPKQKEIFYSAMYHSLLFPREFSEYGKYYSAFDDKIHEGISYNDYSLWDTYRAEHPLLILVAPERVPHMVQSLVQMYQEGGYMPKWPNPTYTGIMIATHADAVIADAVAKGVTGFDLQEAYRACRKDAFVPSAGDSLKRWANRALYTSPETRAGLSWYMKLGFVPADKTAESVSNTLEGAYDDFCVAQVAKAAGRLDDYTLLMQRSKNYVNLYNPKVGMMAPRNSDSTWCKNRLTGFTEGSPWTYLFAVQHDIPGLITLMGGPQAFIHKLNMNFRCLRYWHENEPGHHYTYLYDYVGMPWKTQQMVAKYRKRKYHDTPHGLTGDDDCGQMSAWYVLSALGFYPVTPGTEVYAIGTPLFAKATLYYNPEDRTQQFQVIAHHVSSKNSYVQSMKLNGKVLTEPFLHHADIFRGGTLEFDMGPKPKK